MDASKKIDFAVLDINLGGELIYPVSDRLSRSEIPFVYFTSYDAELLPPDVRASTFIAKMSGTNALVDHIRAAMRKPDRYQRAVEAIPALREAARALMHDDNAADDLVEEALRRAITEVEDEARYLSTEHWLHAILDSVYRQRLDRLN